MISRKSCLIVLQAVIVFAVLTSGEKAQAAYFVDNAAFGCSNGSASYNPATRTCSGGSDIVYSSLATAGGNVQAGISGNPTIINVRSGTYYESFTINRGNTTWRKYPGDSSQPVIDGNKTLPGTQYGALIVIGANNVTLDGLTVKNSTETGIDVVNSIGTTIRNCTITQTGGSGIITGRPGVNNSTLIEDSDISYGNQCFKWGTCSGWANIGNNVVLQGRFNTIRRSNVSFGGSAGIEDYVGEYSLIEYNRIFGNLSDGVHFAKTANGTVRYNLIYGVEGADGWQSGIKLATETWYEGTGWDSGHEVYGNFLANLNQGIYLAADDNGNYKNNRLSNCKIYNNTIIAPRKRGSSEWDGAGILVFDSTLLGTGHSIKNNIIWANTGRVSYGYANPSKVEFGYNLWSSDPGSSFRGAGDLAYAAPNLAKSSDWSNLSAGSITPESFRILSGSPAIDKGIAISNPSYTNGRAEVKYNMDYWSVSRPQGAAWDIGAHEYGSGMTNPICGDKICNGVETCSACPGDCGMCTTPVSVCGDGKCNSGETGLNCPQDCGGPLDEIAKTGWTLHYADSQEKVKENGAATNAFDGLSSTIWHTEWGLTSPTQPHDIQINLNGDYKLSGFRYLPRQDGGQNGTIKGYEFYISQDGKNWSKIASGAFTGDAGVKEVTFGSVTARYVWLKSLSEINGNNWTSVAEIGLIGSAAPSGSSPALAESTQLQPQPSTGKTIVPPSTSTQVLLPDASVNALSTNDTLSVNDTGMETTIPATEESASLPVLLPTTSGSVSPKASTQVLVPADNEDYTAMTNEQKEHRKKRQYLRK